MNPIVNLTDINKLLKSDEIFIKIYGLYGSPPSWCRPEGFSSLAKIILEQQVSLQSANAHYNKLNAYLPAFIPDEIIKLSDEEMRLCQISRQKSKYLRELSLAILNGKIDLEKLAELPFDKVRVELKSIKGIGDWTVDIYQMFCLQSKDVFPSGDIAIINTMKELANVFSREEIIQCSEKWKPYRSLATYFLWHHYLSKRMRF